MKNQKTPCRVKDINRREATSRRKLPVFHSYKSESICDEKEMLFIDKIWSPMVHFYLCVHLFSPYLLHSPSANLSEFYPPIFSPLFLSSFIHFTIRRKTTAILDQWSNLGASLFPSVRYSSSLLNVLGILQSEIFSPTRDSPLSSYLSILLHLSF